MEQGAIDALDKFVPSRENMPDLQGNPLNRGLTSDAIAKVNEPPQPHLSYLCEALSALQTLIILSENLVGRFRSEQGEERAGGFPFSSILSPADVPPAAPACHAVTTLTPSSSCDLYTHFPNNAPKGCSQIK